MGKGSAMKRYNAPYNSPHARSPHNALHSPSIYTYSLFPRHSLSVVLQATVGGGEDLGMTPLLCEVYASGKR